MCETSGHDQGLAHDVCELITRRRLLGFLGAAGTLPWLAACDGPSFGAPERELRGQAADGSACVGHPAETAGPFPADGSNRAHGTLANVLSESGIVRRDLRPNIGEGADTHAPGAPLELTARLVDVEQGCRPLAGYALYLWHCDAEGRYSLYDLAEANYLRGVGVSDASGSVTFTTIVPGCYLGRAPHMHFEVYPSLEKTASYKNRILTSQLALPGPACKEVYDRLDAYGTSRSHFARTPALERDGIFADNTPAQLAAQTLVVTGGPEGVYRAAVTIGLGAQALIR